MRLIGKKVDDVLIEYIGPDTEINNFHTGAPQVEVKVVGTGSVQLHYNSSPIIKSSSLTGPVGLAVDYLPEDAGWAPIGAAVSNGASVMVPVAATTNSRCFIRAVVTAVGEGQVHLRSLWH